MVFEPQDRARNAGLLRRNKNDEENGMNVCLKKHFGKSEITENEVINILKNLLCATVGKIQQLKKDCKLPACLSLLIEALIRDINAGQLDTFISIIDSIF